MDPLCGIIPQYLLESIINIGLAPQYIIDRCQSTIEKTKQLHDTRVIHGQSIQSAQRQRPSEVAGDSRHLKRTIHDAHNSWDFDSSRDKVLIEEGGALIPEDLSNDPNACYVALGKTYDFYSMIFGRKSVDSMGMKLDGFVHFGENFYNAFWTGKELVFGDGDGVIFGSFTDELDVIAHEFTHGVVQYASPLNYTFQSGALNESLADVFGVMVKQWAENHPQSVDQADWLIGEGIWAAGINGRGLRDMKNPGTAYSDSRVGRDCQPGHWRDFKNLDITEDSGGVHINSGIPNRAFYLSATMIGGYAWEGAGLIWYKALTSGKLGENATFKDFADLTIENAGEHVDQIREAWILVGYPFPEPERYDDVVDVASAPISSALEGSDDYPCDDAEEANTGLRWDSPRSEYGLEAVAGTDQATPDIKEKIRSDILDGIFSFPGFSADINPQTQELYGTFTLDWDPLSFMKEQQYAGRPGEALERAITLTGCANDAQAVTAGAYLTQTWPATGKHVMQLVVDAISNTTEDHVTVNLPDGTGLVARVDGRKFIVKTMGTGGLIAEIAQELAWLGAALRSSRFETGVALCSPLFHSTLALDRESSPPGPRPMPCAAISCTIGFRMHQLATSGEELPGQCWHKMFRNPVLVSGYPILAKPEGRLGLEIPLNMMAGLTGSERANNYDGKILIKGFSSMLVATKIVEDLIIWHHYYVDGGSRISYYDATLADVDHIRLAQLDAARHVVGWCSNCSYNAGASDARYDIGRTGLPAPHAGCILQNVSISGGKFITAGATIAIGVKDVPPHLSRDGYISNLKWIATKYVVLWDEEDKRGWLINGVSALLHLVRTSLRHHSLGKFSSCFLFDPTKMKDANDHRPDSAIEVLSDRNNRELEIWLDKTERFEEETHGTEGHKTIKTKRTYYLFENLVRQHFNILEQVMDHHTHLAGRNGVNLKLRVRKHLEGWDFMELATDHDPRPRVATLHALGYGWVDLVRSIDAITLFGRGFGDIIRPIKFDGMCPTWEILPARKYYLAASVFDLKAIVKGFGDDRANPPRLVHDLLWPCPQTLVAPCQCQKNGASNTRRPFEHHDPVQILYPKKSRLFLTSQGPPDELEDGGAVIFGHNFTWRYHWGEKGQDGLVMGDLHISPSSW